MLYVVWHQASATGSYSHRAIAQNFTTKHCRNLGACSYMHCSIPQRWESMLVDSVPIPRYHCTKWELSWNPEALLAYHFTVTIESLSLVGKRPSVSRVESNSLSLGGCQAAFRVFSAILQSIGCRYQLCFWLICIGWIGVNRQVWWAIAQKQTYDLFIFRMLSVSSDSWWEWFSVCETGYRQCNPGEFWSIL